MPASKSELAPARGTAPVSVDIDSEVIVVEAPTAEQALAQVAAQLGDDARIVSAERIQRGGLAGFFAKEMVQITAAAPTPSRTAVGAGWRGETRRDRRAATEPASDEQLPASVDSVIDLLSDRVEIGRASCRERVSYSV